MAKVARSLAGKVVAITGGARGIGRATAAALIAQGARVAIGDIEAPLAERTAQELGSGTVGLPLDVTDRASFETFMRQTESALGPLDVLINNAGIMPIGPFVEETDATAKRMIDINLHGVIFGSKLALEPVPAPRPWAPGQHRLGGRQGRGSRAAPPTARPSTRWWGSARRSAPSPPHRHRRQHRDAGRRQHRARLGPSGDARHQGRAAEDVADAIVEALQTGRFEVFVPKAMSGMVRFNALMPRRAMEAISRLMKGDQVLMAPDHGARAAYEAQMMETIAPAEEPSLPDTWSEPGVQRRPPAKRADQVSRKAPGRPARRQAPGPSQAAISRPISGPASSWRKWLASAITWSTSVPSAAANRRPVSSGSTGSESAHSTSFGRSSSRSASSTRCRPRRPAYRARSGASAGTRGRRPSTPGSGTGRRRRRSPRRRGRACTRRLTRKPTGRSSVRSTKSRNAHPGVGHLLVAGEQPGVQDHHPRDPVRVLDRQPQPDRPAPVVHDDGGVAHVELLEQRRHRRGVAVVAVPVDVDRLVRAAEAGQVGRDAAVAGVAHRRDHLAPQKRPGRLAVEEDDRRAVALVDVGEAQAVELAVSAAGTGSRGGLRGSGPGCGWRRTRG